MSKDKKKGKKKEKKVIKRKIVTLKKKKKRWVSILAPANFGSKELGDSYVTDSQELKGKNLDISLSNLNRGKNPSIKIIFEVVEVIDGKGICETCGYHVLNSFARRIIKKGKTKVLKSYKLRTKDNVNVVLKLVLVTKSKIKRGIGGALRRELDEFVKEEMKKNDFEANLDNIINYKLQKSIKEVLKKVYPVSSLEILMFKKI